MSICADNYNYFRFKLKDNGRSEFWEVYLYGDQTIKVDRDSAEVLPRRVPPPGIDGVSFGSSPNLVMDHNVYETVSAFRARRIRRLLMTFEFRKSSIAVELQVPPTHLTVVPKGSVQHVTRHKHPS